MTRGQIAVIINKDALLTSTEFNGDMYMPEPHCKGYGQDVIDLLKDTNDIADYNFSVAKFNKEHHHYCDRKLIWEYKDKKVVEMLDMSKDYFENWFSDYVYIKNLSKETITMVDDTKAEIKLEPNNIAVFNFGKFLFKV